MRRRQEAEDAKLRAKQEKEAEKLRAKQAKENERLAAIKAKENERLAAAKAKANAEAKARRDKARRKAHALWNAAKPAPDSHAYLLRKGVPSFGLRMGAWPKWREERPGERREIRIPNALLVPICSPSGTLHSLQAIFTEKVDGRDKDFLPGGEKAGKFHLIGEVSGGCPVVVAEGYATAASLHLATGWPVVVAFDANNMEAVARALKDAHPGARIVLAADDDAFGHCQACNAPVQVADGDTCPSCGAPTDKVNMAGTCEYCGAHLTRGEFDWVLSKIEQDESYRG